MKKQWPKLSIKETNDQIDKALAWLTQFRDEMILKDIALEKRCDDLLYELNHLKQIWK